jgi:hypothetical protein
MEINEHVNLQRYIKYASNNFIWISPTLRGMQEANHLKFKIKLLRRAERRLRASYRMALSSDKKTKKREL